MGKIVGLKKHKSQNISDSFSYLFPVAVHSMPNCFSHRRIRLIESNAKFIRLKSNLKGTVP
jgi:hypothetical protein